MILTVKILDKVFNRIQGASEACLGFLFGVLDTQKQTVWIISLEKPLGKSLVNSYPVGVNVCGTFQIGQENDRNMGEERGDSNTSVIITATLGQEKSFKVFLSNNGKLGIDYEVVDEAEFYREHILINCRGEIPIQCEYEKEVIKDYVLNLKNNLSAHRSLGFKLSNSNIFLIHNKVMGTDAKVSVNEIYCELNQSEEIVTRKKKNSGGSLRVLELDMLWKKTLTEENTEKSRHAPVCILNKNTSTVIDTVANIDTLVIVPYSLEIYVLYDILLQAVKRYLNLFEDNLREYIGFQKDDSNSLKFETFHFYPVECGCFITLLYLESKSEDSLKPYRHLLHKQLLLDEITPKFRRANRYIFNSMNKSSSILVNPHVEVKTTDNGGDIALVRGKYEYYHYCQNNEDDNGWGCAYRSLQTLASWFKLQGYVDKPVPSITDIQKCLVDIKDKPASFVGSRQWIGSTEVGFVLNTLLGVDSKILHVTSGEEMGSKGTELVSHFLTQGSPIMIGGGVLAHTILGVDYNRSTGKLKFLILDPHYTGTEDLRTVQSKGWCGWKGVEFWKKGSYYNMCLPQVPKDL